MSARLPAQRAFEERTCAAFGRRRDPVMGRYADFRHSARPTSLAWRHCRCQGQDLLLRQWQHHSVHSAYPPEGFSAKTTRRVSSSPVLACGDHGHSRHASAQVLMLVLQDSTVPLRLRSREIGGDGSQGDNVDRTIDAPKCGRRTSRALHMLL